MQWLHIILERKHLDGILISYQPNITYLTGFPSSDSYLLVTPRRNFFITDSRYYQQARLFFNPVRKKPRRQEGLSNGVKSLNVALTEESIFITIAKLARSEKVKRLGFEARDLDVAQYRQIKKFLGPVNFVSTQELIEEIRKIKKPRELTNIKKAISISAQALRYARRIIHPGLSELEIAGELERFIRNKGARTTAFHTIVASGENSSFPHHLTSKRKLQKRDSLFIDIGVD